MPSETDPLLEVAGRVYGADPGEFVAQRDSAAKEATDKGLGKRIKALRKPSVPAWAVNLLVRREAGQIDQVLALGEQLRKAAESLDGEELRALTRQRRQLTHALADTARRLARENGQRLTAPVVDEIEGMLNAALLDPVAADVVRTGLVLRGFTSTGISEVDVEAVCAVPDAVGHRATPVEPPEEHPAPQLHVVPDDTMKLAAAREKVEEAATQLADAERERDAAVQEVKRLQARRLQLREEIDELQRRLAELEDEVDSVDEGLEDAESEQEDAEAEVSRAERAVAAAEKALAKLS